MSDLRLRLPYRLDCDNLCQFVGRFEDACPNGLPSTLVIDFRDLGWIEPEGVTFLSNFVQWLAERQVKTFFENHRTANGPLRFLDDSLFFEQHTGKKVNSLAAPRSTTIPLVKVQHDESHPLLRNKLVPWLASTLGVTKASLGGFQVCLSEIFNNIKDHTATDTGSMFVQHFPNGKFPRGARVSVAIADFGRGIPTAVRGVLPNLDDTDAIIKAVEAGFTTKSTARNQGQGLDYLLQTVVGANEGKVRISSLSGHVLFYNHGNAVRHQKLTVNGFCPGMRQPIAA